MAVEQRSPAELRAEHDDLARRLADRPSVAALRRGVAMVFVGLMAFGVAWALLWDRYGRTPTEYALAHTDLFRFGAVAVGLVWLGLFAGGGWALLRARRLSREEHRLFARLRELRRALGIDP